MNKVIKADLDTAAYFMLYGASLIEINLNPTGWRFKLERPSGLFEDIKVQPLVNYKAYMHKRRKLKEKIDQVTNKVHIKKSDWSKNRSRHKLNF